MDKTIATQLADQKGMYPGLGLPLLHMNQPYTGSRVGEYEWKHYPIGAHASSPGAISDIIFVRELAMMNIMEQLTNKEDWNKKVFDE